MTPENEKSESRIAEFNYVFKSAPDHETLLMIGTNIRLLLVDFT